MKGLKNSKFDLSGRVAVVTGGAGLLGLEHTHALLDAGASVAVVDISKTALSAIGTQLRTEIDSQRVLPLQLDVTDVGQVRAVRHALVERFGRIDILINNAAIDAKVDARGAQVEMSRLENFTLEQWHREMSVGLTGAFLCSQSFGCWMAEHGGGVIVNVASDLSVISPDQRLYEQEGVTKDMQPVKPVTYSVIKTALIGLTRYLATYWAEQGVRVNALSPGGVYAGQPEVFVSRLISRIPLGRMAHSGDYRAAVQFLSSDASSYMTGQNLIIDGGRSAW